MNGRLLFLGGILGLAALGALVRYVRMPATAQASPPALPFATSAAPEHRSRVGRSASEAEAMVVVYVAGEVLHPGVYRLAANERAESALRAAGGATGNADLVAVNLAEPLRDGEEIAVPARGALEPDAVVPRKHRNVAAHGSRRRKRRARTPRASKDDSIQSVDINTADEEQLQALPGIGPSLAARIMAYRRLNGPFQMLDDVRDVGGMTDGKFDRIAPYLLVP